MVDIRESVAWSSSEKCRYAVKVSCNVPVRAAERREDEEELITHEHSVKL